MFYKNTCFKNQLKMNEFLNQLIENEFLNGYHLFMGANTLEKRKIISSLTQAWCRPALFEEPYVCLYVLLCNN